MSKLKMISASAGSGKTYSLTKSVLQAVISGIPPERIMAVTFTNKAAAELVERIREKLVKPEPEWIQEMGLTDAMVQKLREQAASLSDAYIGTVNGICARLLKEFAFEAGMSPTVDILPEEEAGRLFRLAVSHELGKYYPALSGAARRLGRDGSGKGFQQKPDWQNDVKRLVELARSNGINAKALKGMSAASVSGLTDMLGKTWKSVNHQDLQAKVRVALGEIEVLDDDTKATKGAISALRKMNHAFDHGYSIWADWSSLASIAAGKRSGADACLDDVRDYAAKVQGHPDLHADVKTLIEGVFDCASEALESFDQFKRCNGLMDFVDQESKVLALLADDAVRARISERIELVMVDEFQDTSPIQLALFTRLGELVKQCVWVGDQKQAIYGFRGADPVLMDRVIDGLGDDQLSILEHSWRSRKGLVDFANEVFEHAFSPMPAERVRLNAMRKDKQGLGTPLSVWRIQGDNKAERGMALAEGIASLLRKPDACMVEDRHTGEVRPIKAGDIAVLCRTNSACGQVAESLAHYGISASYGRGSLFTRPECAVVLAGLRLLVDAEDTLALAELVQYLPGHASAGTWLSELVQDRKSAFADWQKDERVSALLAMSGHSVESGPQELLHMVADVLGIRGNLYSFADPKQALANLEALERMVMQYQDSCSSRHQGASLPGLIYWLSRQEQPSLPEGKGENTVQVYSYHGSKGLEWSLVILFDLDSSAKYSPFGAVVASSGEFNPTDPLANRSIRYWPEPISGKGIPFTESVENSDAYAAAKATELAERKRLMYVGVTRARDYLVLAQPVGKRAGDISWMHALFDGVDAEICVPQPGDKEPSVGVGEKSFECVSQQHLAVAEPERLGKTEEEWFIPPLTPSATPHLPFSVVPSGYESPDVLTVSVGAVSRLGERSDLKDDADMTSVGEAVHAFIAADRLEMSAVQRSELASGILSGWGVSSVLSSEQLTTFSSRIHEWVSEQWPNAVIRKEWPMRMRLGEQIAHGWIDMLLELPEGYVVIDHKSYPGDEPEERAKKYASQLELYREAIQQATGKPVLETLIHMPVQGVVVPLNFQ